jgi:hypothetical protein
MLVSGGIAQEQLGEAFAQFALSHPMTYSPDALRVALDLLKAEPVELDEGEANEAVQATRPNGRFWRRCVRRASCH